MIVASFLAHRQYLERETGIEPATNSLEGCDSTTELLPPEQPEANLKQPCSREPPDPIQEPPGLLSGVYLPSIAALKLMELMMGLEPMTSPLPRECSTTELHQPLCPFACLESRAQMRAHDSQPKETEKHNRKPANRNLPTFKPHVPVGKPMHMDHCGWINREPCQHS